MAKKTKQGKPTKPASGFLDKNGIVKRYNEVVSICPLPFRTSTASLCSKQKSHTAMATKPRQNKPTQRESDATKKNLERVKLILEIIANLLTIWLTAKGTH